MTELEDLRLENKSLKMQKFVLLHRLHQMHRDWLANAIGRDAALKKYYANELLREIRALENEIDKVRYVEVK